LEYNKSDEARAVEAAKNENPRLWELGEEQPWRNWTPVMLSPTAQMPQARRAYKSCQALPACTAPGPVQLLVPCSSRAEAMTGRFQRPSGVAKGPLGSMVEKKRF